ncbi:type II secretion system F family protein [Candidatus Coxiella mudrowiae]|uniref:type II secretion system F family protein n=1 Tax=Candidatus Coxiella mudrowiae TaxID=2054173 RepID=UPI0027D2AB8A|nr:type II secretion system F family protein [Candidatus Coxiella mudrowiae]
MNSACFGRTFGVLNAATVPVLEAMQATSQLITVLSMCYTVEVAIEKVREGTNIHRVFQKILYFSNIFIHLVASGESSGQLEAVLQKAVTTQEEDIAELIDGSLTLLEPVMILLMGSVVLFIVLAIMLPIFDLD